MTKNEKEALFTEEYHRLFRRIFGYIILRMQSKHDAEDITSDIFIKGYTKIEQYDPEHGTIEQWLMGIAKHHLIDYWRSQKNHINIDDITITDSESTNKMTQKMDAKHATEILSANLTSEQHLLLTLRHIDEYSHKEIASFLGKSEEAVRKAVSRLEHTIRERFPHLIHDIV